MNLTSILQAPRSAEDFHRAVKERRRPSQASYFLAENARYIAQHAPEFRDHLIAQANLALAGKLVLPGTAAKPYFVGNPPDWHANPVGDEEYVWGLNRMGHWKTLLEAFTLTSDRRYAQKVVGELADWLARCPCPSINTERTAAYKAFYAVDPWRALEVGIRMFDTWPAIFEHLLETDLLSPALFSQLASAMHRHAEVLAEISPIFWPRADHNHYLMENLGLLSVAALFPEFTLSSSWRQHAVRELERCAAAQLTADGGQIEGCPAYHNGCVVWFCLALRVAQPQGLQFSPQYHERLQCAVAYSLHALRPTGAGVPWGDSDADSSAVQAVLHWFLVSEDAAPLHIVRDLVGPAEVRRQILQLWPAAPLQTLLAAAELPTTGPTPALIAWQKDLKQVMLRTSWRPDALSVFFACRTPVNNGHAHVDPMGFDFTALGRALVVDPGRFTYRWDDDRRHFKSAEWHNTLTINHKPPFEAISTWNFTPQKLGEIIGISPSDGLLAAAARQCNYEPAIHCRLVAIVQQQFLLVLDQVTGLSTSDSVQLFYHLNSIALEWNNAAHRAFADCGDVRLAIFTTPNLAGTVRDGKISEFLDVFVPSRRLCLEDSASNTTARLYATILFPYRAGGPAPQLEKLQVELIGASDSSDNTLLCTFTLLGRPHRLHWQRDPFTCSFA